MTTVTNQQALPSEALLSRIRQSDRHLSVEDAFVEPAWFTDQRTWVQDPSSSNSVAYNLPLFLRIEGHLKYELLRSALYKLQARHQALRSIFRFLDAELIQIVLTDRTIDIPVTALAESENNTEDREFQEICRREASKPFDLSQEPALRAHLLQFRDDKYVLLLTTHHLVCDDWSTGLLLRELFLIYEALSDPASSMLPAKGTFQYTDFIRWYEGQLQGERIASRLSFWKRELKDADDFHHLDSDRPRPARRTYSGACAAETIPASLLDSLRELGQRERVSLFMALLTGFLCTLHRHSGDDDVAVGSCAANRALTEMEYVVGRFANDLVVRANLSGSPTFREALSRIRTRALTAYSYQDLPFAQLVETIQPQAAPGRNRLFQTMFILQDAPKNKFQCRGLSIRKLPFDSGTAKFDLAVYMFPQESGLEICLEYNTDLFDATTIRQLLYDYREMLEEMVRHPDAQINDHDEGKRAPVSHPASHPLHTKPLVFQDSLEARLVKLWQECFRTDEISVDDDFFRLGGDSLKAARMFANIEQCFAVRIPIVALIECPTIRQLARLIRDSRSSGAFNSVVEIQRGGFHPPLFCAHGQSGNLLFYRSLAEHLGPDQPVYGLQPQGIDGKQAPLTSIEEMATLYIEEIRRVYRHGPYFLAGYCMGGLVVLEMAQQLKRTSQAVGLVALLDSYNVHNLQQSRFRELQFAVQKVWFGLCHFLRTDSRNRLTFLRRRLEELGAPSSVISETNERASFAYVPKKYPGPLLHIVPKHQYSRYRNPRVSWDGLATGGVEALVLPIYPGQMFEEPSVAILAAKLQACMNESSVQQVA
jgi:thioesterase domain-containing protein/acyl carrier protein